MSWTDTVSFLGGANFTKATVNEKEIKFYPISVSTLFRLKALGKPLAKALALIMGDKTVETSLINRHIEDEDGNSVMEEHIKAIESDLLREKFGLREDTITSVIEAFLNEESRDLVGMVIMESIKDEFGEEKAPPAKEFMAKLDLSTLVQLVVGVIGANSGALEPVQQGNALAPQGA